MVVVEVVLEVGSWFILDSIDLLELKGSFHPPSIHQGFPTAAKMASSSWKGKV